jgi:Flp pilus assembly protein TadG
MGGKRYTLLTVAPKRCSQAFSEDIEVSRKKVLRARPRGERGAEILEFAFVFTLLAALALGIMAFARAYNVYQTINRAAREGARMAALPSSVYDGNTFIDGSTTYTAPDSPIFTDYIAPALRAANLGTSSCASSTSTNCITNYNEEIGWLDPSGTTDNQCGVSISFTYPYQLSIPFIGSGIGTLDLTANVQMRREDQPTTNSFSGTATCP